MPFLETGADELLAELLPTGRLELSTDPTMLGRSEPIVSSSGRRSTSSSGRR